MGQTGCPGCLAFACDAQVVEGKGYFSFTEALIRYAKEESAVQRGNFHNTTAYAITSEKHAMEQATSECVIKYTDSQVYHDDANHMWMVLFYTAGALGGCQEVYLDSKGITQLIVYGE